MIMVVPANLVAPHFKNLVFPLSAWEYNIMRYCRIFHHAYFSALHRAMPFAALLAVISMGAEAKTWFNPALLELDSPEKSTVDLSIFESQGAQAPGNYRVHILVNNTEFSDENIEFVTGENKKLIPVLKPAQLSKWGVNLNSTEKLAAAPLDKPISSLADLIPKADSNFAFSSQTLKLSIPQENISATAHDYIDPEKWDDGEAVLFTNYSWSASQNKSEHGENSNNGYLNLQSGLNLGAWRLRNYSSFSYGQGGEKWSSMNSYLQRSFQALGGVSLTMGQTYTPGDIFDSVQYTGAQLETEEEMRPDSLRGFAPVIRGIANSNARVTIRQNGYIIYQNYVPAGPFQITDLYPTASGGDLDVTITEADGSERHFVQPFASVPNMQREGSMKYALSAGRYRSNSASSDPVFSQGTLSYGLSNYVTLYGGVIAAANYFSAVTGAGIGLGILGSIAVDVSQAQARFSHSPDSQGQSWRFQYSKEIEATNTAVTLAGYRYSTKGYYTFQEAADREGQATSWQGNKRSRIQLNINQSLGDRSNFYIAGTQDDFWGGTDTQKSMSAGIRTSTEWANFGVALSLVHDRVHSDNDRQIAFDIQVSLAKLLPKAWMQYSVTTNTHGATQHQAGMNGTLLENNQLQYSVQQTMGNRQQQSGGNAQLGWLAPYSDLTLGYSYGGGSKRINYGMDGGVVVHRHGVTLSHTIGDTFGLIEAPGVKDLEISSSQNVYTDSRGYAVIPYLTPWHYNDISIDTHKLASNADIDAIHRDVVPTKGAMVVMRYKTHLGKRALITLHMGQGYVPFGATVTLEGTDEAGIVGDNGVVFLSGLTDSGNLHVVWGKGRVNECHAPYHLASPGKNQAQIVSGDAQCSGGT